ncbi:hypothetical protein FE772_19150 [Lysobacter enzymogenes]|nr:hypothetical protein [Lysobacter enzymogenes]QCW27439.1 hypothetical protein FE772_19150 [Lysobacter enzymogenes]
MPAASPRAAAATAEANRLPDRVVAPPSDGRSVDFAALDLDGDGAINREESRAHGALSANFLAVDVNADGRISVDEVNAWRR